MSPGSWILERGLEVECGLWWEGTLADADLYIEGTVRRGPEWDLVKYGLLSSSKNDLLTWGYRTFPSVGVGNPHSDRTPTWSRDFAKGKDFSRWVGAPHMTSPGLPLGFHAALSTELSLKLQDSLQGPSQEYHIHYK